MKRVEPFDMSGRMRCFLHLVKDSVVLTDNTGVDAADSGTAIVEILMALRDLRVSDPDAEDHWEGWSLRVVDDTGHVLSTITLDEPEESAEVPHRRRQHA